MSSVPPEIAALAHQHAASVTVPPGFEMHASPGEELTDGWLFEYRYRTSFEPGSPDAALCGAPAFAILKTDRSVRQLTVGNWAAVKEARSATAVAARGELLGS